MKRLLIIVMLGLLGMAGFSQNIPRPNLPAPKGLTVNSFTGNLFYQRNEMSLRGTGYRIYQTFYYNAATDTLDYGYGHGWSFYYNVFYRQMGDTIIIQHSDAKKDTFRLVSGAYKAPLGVYDTLIKSGAILTLKSKDGKQQIFGDTTHKKLTRMQDANGNFVVVEYAENVPAKIRNSTGRCLLLSWQYDHLTEAKDSANPAKKYTYGYDTKNDMVLATNPINGRMRFEYIKHGLARLADENNNPVLITYGGGGRVKSISSCNTEQQFSYAVEQRKTFVAQKGQSGVISNGYYFDTSGRLSALIDADGNKTIFNYDNKNNLTEWKNVKGLTTKYEYDSKGNLLKETDPLGNSITYTYEPAFYNIASVKNKKGNTTAFTYDTKGNLLSVNKPGSITESFTYDARGRRVTATNANNNITTYQYNADGDLSKVIYPIGETKYEYNGSCCSVGKITDANGGTIEMTYDLLGRTTSVKDKTGNIIAYEYDAAGNVVKEIDPNGVPKEYGYDALNRLTSVKIKAGIWSYEYDAQSNLVKITDANGHITRYDYNKKKQLVKETDAIGNSTGYAYDVSGNLVLRNDPNDNSVAYKYDELNHLTEKSYTGNTDKYSYDEAGNLTTAYNNNIAYSFEYDNLNRLLKKNIITWGKSLSYTYDAAGNRKTMKDHDGGNYNYLYDANGRLTSLTNASNLTTTFAYDAGGRLIRQNNANNTFSTYHYDEAGRLDSLINSKNPTEKISFFYYTFDSYGNRLTMKDKHGLNSYTYDSSYRLTKVIYADNSVETFGIDGTGNRTIRTKNGVTTPYYYNNADQIQTAGTSNFVFDKNGNTVQQTDSLQKVFKYDGENRLLEVQLNPQRRVQYQYDPFGDKIIKLDTMMNVTKMLYDGNNILSELNTANVTLSKYTTAIGIDSWISMYNNNNEFFYQKDGLNSTIELVNSNGDIVNEYSYDVYGNTINKSETVKNSILYTGRLYEEDIKLYDYRSRFFNSEISRFLSKDYFNGFIDLPLTTNHYSYVGNNPTNYNDPTGMFESGYNLSYVIIETAEEIYHRVGKLMEKFDKAKTAKESAEIIKCVADQNKMAEEEMKKLSQTSKKRVTSMDDDQYMLDQTMIGGRQIQNLPRNGAGLHDVGREYAPGYSSPEEKRDPCDDPPKEQGTDDHSYIPKFQPIATIRPVAPKDPNEIYGPAGYDTTEHWVSVSATLPYKVAFENDPKFATAPAQKVTIYLPITEKLNANSLRISDFGFGGFNFTVPENSPVYSTRLDVRDSLGVFVDVTAGLDPATHRAFWIFQSIDPATNTFYSVPPNIGLLPVNDSLTHKGEGYVTFTLKPNATSQTGDTATAQASIIFDSQPAIATNTWKNTIDAVAPISNVVLMPPYVYPDFPIKWIGRDDTLGSGVQHYDIYYAKNNSSFLLLKDKIDSLGMQFPGGDTGTTYSFYSIATDNTGNREAQKNAGEVSTTVIMPGNCPGGSISFTNASLGAGYTYQWQVDDGSGFANISNGSIYTGSSTNKLVLINAPTSWSGYKYKIIATKNGVVTEGAIQVLRFSSVWSGTISSAWENPANWSCGAIPDEYTDVIIYANVPHSLRLSSNGVCRSLKLSNEAVFTVSAGYNLDVRGK